MKRFSTALVVTSVVGFLVAGCGSDSSCVAGGGAIVSQTISLSALTGFNLEVGAEVTVTPGATQQVMVRGDENIIDLLNTDVLNGVWDIGFTQCVERVSELRIDITLPELTSMELSGAGTVLAETDTGNLDTILSGAGTITVSGQATSQTVSLEGSGTVEAFDLVTAATTVDLSGQGNVNVTATEMLDVDLSGAGAVFYKGDPQLEVRISGIGRVVDAN